MTPDRKCGAMAEAGARGDGLRYRTVSRILLAGISAAVLGAATVEASAESLMQALASAYATNEELDARRAETRAIDEAVPQALSTGRPFVTGNADIGAARQKTILRPPLTGTAATVEPYGYSISVVQPVFRGFRTLNSVKQADALVYAAREALLNTEQNVLFAAVEAYVNVVRDQSVVRLRQNNISVLNEQLRATRDRFDVGEVTRTDVAQAEARLSFAQSTLSVAQANLNSALARYEQVIGHPPNSVVQPPTIQSKLPQNLEQAKAVADGEHPAIQAGVYSVEAADFGVDVTTGELLPVVTVNASWSQRWDSSVNTRRTEDASISGRLTVPFYQGGGVSSRVREAKEVRNQRRIELEQTRHEVRAAVVSAWGQVEATRAQITSSEAQVRANEVALAGVREEANVGQRTTLDVLNAEQELLDSRVALVTARRDHVLASYALLSAIGRLHASKLGLQVAIYDPAVHYLKVRNKWFGLTPPE